jgi:hypothetical protein
LLFSTLDVKYVMESGVEIAGMMRMKHIPLKEGTGYVMILQLCGIIR